MFLPVIHCTKSEEMKQVAVIGWQYETTIIATVEGIQHYCKCLSFLYFVF